MKRNPLTLLRRTWIIPVRSDDDWGTIPHAHVEVERGSGIPLVSELFVEINGKRVLMLERNHPGFRDWMSDLISALTEAMNEPCDVLSWAQEHFDEEERRFEGIVARLKPPREVPVWWPQTAVELDQIMAGIPAGAHPIWQPRKLDVVWHLPGADVDLRPWRGRSAAEKYWGELAELPPSR